MKRILITDAGEATLRIARTCERLGHTSIGLSTAAQPNDRHVSECVEVVKVEALTPDVLAKVIEEHSIDAVHPGYQLPPALGQATLDAGALWLGGHPKVLLAIEQRAELRALASELGLKVREGRDDLAPDDVEEVADSYGYPILLRPSARQSSRGGVRVKNRAELVEALARIRRRAEKKGVNAKVTVERAYSTDRVLELGLLADAKGERLSLAEREVSLSVDGWPILVEAPSTLITGRSDGAAIRLMLEELVLRFVEKLEFVGICHVRFLLDASGHVVFDDVLAGLPAHHPVIEMVTGLDLVEEQLRLASGEPIPDIHFQKHLNGHALSARLSAENAKTGFVRSTGPIEDVWWPPGARARLRVDAYRDKGDEIDPHGDALLARISTHAPTRHRALLHLDRVLHELRFAPRETTAPLLRVVLNDEAFRFGVYDVGFLVRALETLKNPPKDEPPKVSKPSSGGGNRGGGGRSGGGRRDGGKRGRRGGRR